MSEDEINWDEIFRLAIDTSKPFMIRHGAVCLIQQMIRSQGLSLLNNPPRATSKTIKFRRYATITETKPFYEDITEAGYAL